MDVKRVRCKICILQRTPVRQKTSFFDEKGCSPLSQRAVALFGRGEGAAFVGASCVSLTSARRRRLVRSAAPPLPGTGSVRAGEPGFRSLSCVFFQVRADPHRKRDPVYSPFCGKHEPERGKEKAAHGFRARLSDDFRALCPAKDPEMSNYLLRISRL